MVATFASMLMWILVAVDVDAADPPRPPNNVWIWADNLAREHPEIVARLRRHAERFSPQIPKVWSLKYPVRHPQKAHGAVRRE